MPRDAFGKDEKDTQYLMKWLSAEPSCPADGRFARPAQPDAEKRLSMVLGALHREDKILKSKTVPPAPAIKP